MSTPPLSIDFFEVRFEAPRYQLRCIAKGCRMLMLAGPELDYQSWEDIALISGPTSSDALDSWACVLAQHYGEWDKTDVVE